MDVPGTDAVALAEDLKNLRTINKYFGGLSAVRKALSSFLREIPLECAITILDLATASADHPIDIVERARRDGRSVHVTAVDNNPHMLTIARAQTSQHPNITIERGDILNLHFPDKSFDIAICSLALHHFSHEDALDILRHMDRLSRVGIIVNDLQRSWIGAGTAWLYTHLTTRNPLTLNDSYVSVLRAFTVPELRELAAKAGLRECAISRRPFFRLVMTARPSVPTKD